ncbi:MAG: prepilin-type N-terminal cleavage/methylation domain-containing protein [Gemmatimonadota bacterium]|nr:MAG: prepilin-type N-terminal cleavage/methylation domain-containing protein [Gemmatimonadota bacterium]
MSRKVTRRGRMSESGFTIVELLVYLIIAVVIVAGVYNLLIGQQRLYMKQRELQDVRSSLRASANLLAWELRQASAAGGDIYNVGTYEVKLRSVQGAGVVCNIHGSQPRLGLVTRWGEFQDAEVDSAFVFLAGSSSTADDGWVISQVAKIWSPSVGGIPDCNWGNSITPDLVAEISGGVTLPDLVDGPISITADGVVAQGSTVTFTAQAPGLTCGEFDGRVNIVIDADTWSDSGTMSGCTFTVAVPLDASKVEIQINIESDLYTQLAEDIFGKSSWLDLGSGAVDPMDIVERVRIGGPVRAFRPVTYGLYFDPDGRWWLGRKVGNAGDWEKMTGPLSPPSDSGLTFIFYDQAGDTTSLPVDVRMVDIILRGESYGKAPQAGELGPDVEEDSLTVRVSLRG